MQYGQRYQSYGDGIYGTVYDEVADSGGAAREFFAFMGSGGVQK